MTPEVGGMAVVGTAAVIAIGHTAVGVDHYVPFAALARSRGWTLRRTLGVVALCALGHIAGSVVLGLLVVGMGLTFDEASWLEAWRGEVAAWALTGFGAVYAAWGLWRARRDGGHHDHGLADTSGRSVTFWSLFIVFVLGPCEPLIPLMVAPGIGHDWALVGLVVLVFGLLTTLTMLVMTVILYRGLHLAPLSLLHKYAHTAAGVAIAGSGLAVALTGL